jgi:hypothetical protein
MGLFKKKEVTEANFIAFEDLENFIETSFKESFLYSKFLTIKDKFDYETNKLLKYSELLLTKEFEKRIVQDKDYFKKSATKANTLILEFINRVTLPESVLKLSNFVDSTINELEKFEPEVTIPLNHIEEVMPKLISRIRLKIQSIEEVMADFSKYINSEKLVAITNVKNFLNEYYNNEEKIQSLQEKRVPVLDELTQISMMKDRAEARLSLLKSRHSMGHLTEIMEERDKLREKLMEISSIVRVNLSHLTEILDSNSYVDAKQLFQIIIPSHDIITLEDYGKIIGKVNSITDPKFKEVIQTVKSFQHNFGDLHLEFKEVTSKMKDNVMYLNVKEQEDAYDLWTSKFNVLKEKIFEIDNTLSDISLNLIKQRINKELQKFSSSTIIE